MTVKISTQSCRLFSASSLGRREERGAHGEGVCGVANDEQVPARVHPRLELGWLRERHATYPIGQLDELSYPVAACAPRRRKGARDLYRGSHEPICCSTCSGDISVNQRCDVPSSGAYICSAYSGCTPCIDMNMLGTENQYARTCRDKAYRTAGAPQPCMRCCLKTSQRQRQQLSVKSVAHFVRG